MVHKETRNVRHFCLILQQLFCNNEAMLDGGVDVMYGISVCAAIKRSEIE